MITKFQGRNLKITHRTSFDLNGLKNGLTKIFENTLESMQIFLILIGGMNFRERSQKNPNVLSSERSERFIIYWKTFQSCVLNGGIVWVILWRHTKGVGFWDPAYHSMARANLNKSDYFLTITITASKYIPSRPWISINRNPPYQTSLHKIFKNCFLWSKSFFTMFTFRGPFNK